MTSRAQEIVGRWASLFNGWGLWSTTQSVWDQTMCSATFDRALYLFLHRLGLMGSGERKALTRLVGPGMTVIDVGANLGLYSVFMARRAGPGGRVISFEPDPDLFALLVRNGAANGLTNLQPLSVALGAAPDRLVLNRLTLNSGDNHLGATGDVVFRRPVEVEVASLDRLFPDVSPHLIKVDVQGWELKVLKGMEAVLKRVESVELLLEICPGLLRRAGDDPLEVYDFLAGLGFGFYSCADWRRIDREAFRALAGRLTGHSHVDVFVSRRGPAVAAPANA
jgi:FkbM family methyltransferase